MKHEKVRQFDPYDVQDRLHVRLLAMGAFGITPDRWIYKGIRNSYWRLYVNAEPGASILWSGGEYSIVPGHVHLVPAWMTYDCRCLNPVDHLYLHFDIVGLGGPMVRRWFDRPITLPGDPLSSMLADRVRFLCKRNRRDDTTAAFSAKSLADLSVSRLFERLEQSGTDGPADGRLLLRGLAELSPVMPALRRIDERLAEPASNAELADRCGMSEDHFIRIFRKCVGQTPARYALERRVAAAAERLALGEDSLKLIAAEAGFANRFHFTRVFTRVIGVPPSEYRRIGPV